MIARIKTVSSDGDQHRKRGHDGDTALPIRDDGIRTNDIPMQTDCGVYYGVFTAEG